MARVKIPLLGVTSTPTSRDGECVNIMNMRPVRGSYKPVAPAQVDMVFSRDYNHLFIHKTELIEKWIGVQDNQIYADVMGSSLLLATLPEKVNSVQQTGNVLSFITDSNIYYAIYKDRGYVYLGELPELPDARYDTSDIKRDGIYPYHRTGIYPNTEEEWIRDFKSTLSLLQHLFINGGKDDNGILHAGFGAHLFDAHLLRYAYRLYDGSLIKYSAPILLMPSEDIMTLKMMENKGDGIPETVLRGYRPYIERIGTIDPKWKDVIQSVDIFLSPALGITNHDTKFREHLPWRGKEILPLKCELIDVMLDDYVEAIKNVSNLYHVKSVSVDEFNSTNRIDVLSDKNKYNNLIFNEAMKNDSFSHHKTGAKGANVLNSRLRLRSVKTTFFDGFKPVNFMFKGKYNGDNSMKYEIDGSFTDLPIISNHDGEEWMSVVTLMVNGRKIYVSSTYTVSNNMLGDSISSMLSYPDTRANHMTIYAKRVDGVYVVENVDLVPHPSLNVAYYCSWQFGVNGRGVYRWRWERLPTVSSNKQVEEKSKLKVSQINNPFLFPVENTYTVGFGNILNEASIVMNVSDRNYGVYPAYVFTDSGVFTMSGQSSDMVHASVQAPTFSEPVVSDVICQTPYGVAFITRSGLMLINQHGTQHLSPQFTTEEVRAYIRNPEKYPYFSIFSGRSFLFFLEGVSVMIYDSVHDELIVSHGNIGYSFVYSFREKQYYMTSYMYDNMVDNAYPKLYALKGRNLLNLEKLGSNRAKVALVTHPLSFDASQSVKRLERVVMRAELHDVNTDVGELREKTTIALFHSIDGVNFEPTRGHRLIKNGNYKDYDLGLLSRTKWRQYVFMFAGEIGIDSEINYLDIEISGEYSNDKMR